MTLHDFLAVIILVQLVLLAFASGQLKSNQPSQYEELGGDKVLFGFFCTMRFIAFFMILGFLRMSDHPIIMKKEVIVYFGFFISLWSVFIGVVYIYLIYKS
ncbi:MAG: hypothetical protein AB8D52_06180 [Gammaproteobacteria bacterium]